MAPSPEAQSAFSQTKERAEQGRDLLNSNETDPRVSARETIEQLEKIQEQYAYPAVESSEKRAQRPGNDYPIPPEDRKPLGGDLTSQQANMAGLALGAARTALTNQLVGDARLMSDPRYERDLKVLELGRQGKLQNVPPTNAEVAVQLARTGVDPEIAKLLPKTPEEQIAQDMPRLQEAADKPAPGSLPLGEEAKLADEAKADAAAHEGNSPVMADEKKVADTSSNTVLSSDNQASPQPSAVIK